MKSFTDLKQSKKLAEFLPLESADMCYMPTDEDDAGIIYYTADYKSEYIIPEDDENIPCWSLAALIEQLPEIINYEDDESDYALEISKENDLYYLSYGNPFEHGKLEVEPQENFVDACYEMIIMLHEQKLL